MRLFEIKPLLAALAAIAVLYAPSCSKPNGGDGGAGQEASAEAAQPKESMEDLERQMDLLDQMSIDEIEAMNAQLDSIMNNMEIPSLQMAVFLDPNDGLTSYYERAANRLQLEYDADRRIEIYVVDGVGDKQLADIFGVKRLPTIMMLRPDQQVDVFNDLLPFIDSSKLGPSPKIEDYERMAYEGMKAQIEKHKEK